MTRKRKLSIVSPLESCSVFDYLILFLSVSDGARLSECCKRLNISCYRTTSSSKILKNIQCKFGVQPKKLHICVKDEKQDGIQKLKMWIKNKEQLYIICSGSNLGVYQKFSFAAKITETFCPDHLSLLSALRNEYIEACIMKFSAIINTTFVIPEDYLMSISIGVKLKNNTYESIGEDHYLYCDDDCFQCGVWNKEKNVAIMHIHGIGWHALEGIPIKHNKR